MAREWRLSLNLPAQDPTKKIFDPSLSDSALESQSSAASQPDLPFVSPELSAANTEDLSPMKSPQNSPLQPTFLPTHPNIGPETMMQSIEKIDQLGLELRDQSDATIPANAGSSLPVISKSGSDVSLGSTTLRTDTMSAKNQADPSFPFSNTTQGNFPLNFSGQMVCFGVVLQKELEHKFNRIELRVLSEHTQSHCSK